MLLNKVYWSFIFRGRRKKKVVLLIMLLLFLIYAMCYVSIQLLKVMAKKEQLYRRLYGPNSKVDRSSMRVIVGYYAGMANGKANLSEEEINANNYSPVPGEGEMGRPVMMRQRELIRSKELYTIHKYNILAGDMIAINRTLPDMRAERCTKITYDIDNLPTASVVIIFNNEAWSTLMRTVMSVLNRSPNKLLKEIILVDDASTRKYLGSEFEATVSTLAKVRLLRQTERRGLVGARLMGARLAQADVLVFLDSHCEVTMGWLEPLLERAGSGEVFVSPRIDIISQDTFTYTPSISTGWGGFCWDLAFRWVPPTKEIRNLIEKDPAQAYPTPTMAGGLFAVRRSLFWRLGGYDEGMKIWGGENLEMSWRAWQCGARVEIAPCSRVAHLFRRESPYEEEAEAILDGNLARAAIVWLDEWAEFYFKFHREAAAVRDKQDVAARLELRHNLNCKSFKWYLENVWPTHYLPTNDTWFGRIRSDKKGCLFAKSYTGKDCGSDSDIDRLLLYTPVGQIVGNSILCLEESANAKISWKRCAVGLSRQIWYHRGQRLKTVKGRCLTLVSKVNSEDGEIVTRRCDSHESGQIWHFEPVPWK